LLRAGMTARERDIISTEARTGIRKYKEGTYQLLTFNSFES
jgi:hypothetical protein